MGEAELVKAFGALFAIMNPFVNLPIFLALTASHSVREQRLLAARVVGLCAAMCAGVLLGGQAILSLFGISIAVFRVAGGLVLAHIAWTMLQGENIAAHHGAPGEKAHMESLTTLAFYPITFPVLVGPGTIAALIVASSHASGPAGYLGLGGVVVAILAMLFVVFYFASLIGTVLSASMRTIMTRLMGMILLAIGVDMVIAGARVAFGVR